MMTRSRSLIEARDAGFVVWPGTESKTKKETKSRSKLVGLHGSRPTSLDGHRPAHDVRASPMDVCKHAMYMLILWIAFHMVCRVVSCGIRREVHDPTISCIPSKAPMTTGICLLDPGLISMMQHDFWHFFEWLMKIEQRKIFYGSNRSWKRN